MINQQELVADIAAISGLKRQQAEAALSATLEAITRALGRGEKVSLHTFGAFQLRERAERRQFNPSSREYMTLHAAVIPVFKPSKKLTERLNA